MAEHRPTSEQRRRVEERAGRCCDYCRSQSSYSASSFAIEHIDPEQAEGGEGLANLAFACQGCNTFKSDAVEAIDPVSGQRVGLFDPRVDAWNDHFRWSENGAHVVGITPTGRATVVQLQLNYPLAVTVRENWVVAGWHPPGGSA